MSHKRAYEWTSQTQKRFCVIRKNKTLDLDKMKNWLDSNMSWYALIVHKEDKDPITHEIIPIHYHFVGESLTRSRPRLKQDCQDFCDYMEINDVGVEWDGYKSMTLALQYLVHKNNPEKTQHDVNEVILYGMTKDEFITWLASESETAINFDYLFNLCNKVDNIVELLREIPPSMFKTHYQYIKCMWNAIHNGKLHDI